MAAKMTYHIQTTADHLREGFPYFNHHDTVSKLWNQKWRTLCEKSVYPFGEGNIEDFTPIFEALIKASPNDCGILSRADDYTIAFFPKGEELVVKAEQAERDGDYDAARDLYQRAVCVYRISRFPIPRTALGRQAWERGRDAYLKGARYVSPSPIPVRIPFKTKAEGDLDDTIPALLTFPEGTRPEDGWPLLLMITGLDGYHTDMQPRVHAHAERGFASLIFDIPGTGDCPAAPNDPQSWDRLMESVIGWVKATANEYHFNKSRILARGMSTGGHYAMRAAHMFPQDLFAVVAQGGGCHHMFDEEWIRVQNQMEYPFLLADALAYKFGYRGENALEDYVREAKRFSLLNSGVLNKPSCRLLLINGMEDSIFPIEDCWLAASTGSNKDILINGNSKHMGDPAAEGQISKWLDEVCGQT